MSIRATFQSVLLASIVAALLIFPFLVTDTYLRHLMITAFLYAVVASNWDLSLGYAGIFNMAHLAFFGVGVYSCAILSKLVGLDPWMAILAAGAVSVALSALICLPILRLRGIYVILVTFAVSELLLRLVLSQRDVTGGAKGMVMIPGLKLGDYQFSLDGKFGYYYISFFLLVASTYALRSFVKSPIGLSVVALKDNEDYAVSRGVSIARSRLMVLTISALFTGLAGGLYAVYFRVASPDIFAFDLLTLILSMVIFGGINTVYGPILGSFTLLFLSELMFDWGPVRYIVNAAIILGTIIFFPAGLYGICQALYPSVARLGGWVLSTFRMKQSFPTDS